MKIKTINLLRTIGTLFNFIAGLIILFTAIVFLTMRGIDNWKNIALLFSAIDLLLVVFFQFSLKNRSYKNLFALDIYSTLSMILAGALNVVMYKLFTANLFLILEIFFIFMAIFYFTLLVALFKKYRIRLAEIEAAKKKKVVRK